MTIRALSVLLAPSLLLACSPPPAEHAERIVGSNKPADFELIWGEAEAAMPASELLAKFGAAVKEHGNIAVLYTSEKWGTARLTSGDNGRIKLDPMMIELTKTGLSIQEIPVPTEDFPGEVLRYVQVCDATDSSPIIVVAAREEITGDQLFEIFDVFVEHAPEIHPIETILPRTSFVVGQRPQPTPGNAEEAAERLLRTMSTPAEGVSVPKVDFTDTDQIGEPPSTEEPSPTAPEASDE